MPSGARRTKRCLNTGGSCARPATSRYAASRSIASAAAQARMRGATLSHSKISTTRCSPTRGRAAGAAPDRAMWRASQGAAVSAGREPPRKDDDPVTPPRAPATPWLANSPMTHDTKSGFTREAEVSTTMEHVWRMTTQRRRMRSERPSNDFGEEPTTAASTSTKRTRIAGRGEMTRRDWAAPPSAAPGARSCEGEAGRRGFFF
ncbi:hypothetical protein M885DRAFT_550543 [Pelagophyceae sp. CCMP2097]|nr:hypothetical protein M885DRAFT_550543 [Pelagophyceae sp. CCMP2097]